VVISESQGKSPWYPHNRKLDEPQSIPARVLVTVLTELPWLHVFSWQKLELQSGYYLAVSSQTGHRRAAIQRTRSNIRTFKQDARRKVKVGVTGKVCSTNLEIWNIYTLVSLKVCTEGVLQNWHTCWELSTVFSLVTKHDIRESFSASIIKKKHGTYTLGRAHLYPWSMLMFCEHAVTKMSRTEIAHGHISSWSSNTKELIVLESFFLCSYDITKPTLF
jgi:hypothetical protein